MSRFKRKLVSMILSLGIILSLYPTGTVVEAASGITTAHIDVICKHYGYESGKYWTYTGNNSTKYSASTTRAGTNGYKGYVYAGGQQCWAFARFLMAKVTGVEVGSGAWKKINASSVSNLQVGDIVCNGDKVHTAVVYKNLGNGKYQFIQVYGGKGNEINIGSFNYYDANNKPQSTNTLAGLKSHGLQYIYRYNGNVNPVPNVINVKTTCDNKGATIEFDVENVSSVKSVRITAWSLADGWGIDKYKAYTTPSVNGNHYTFRVNKSDFGNMSGDYKSNIFINDYVRFRDLTYTIPDYNNPYGYLDGIESLCEGKIIHVCGWAYDADNPSASLDIHAYVGGRGGNTSAFAALIKADLYRKDVNDTIGISGNHGFDYYIPINKTGTQEVNLYAINIGGGVENPLLINGRQTFVINPNSNHIWDGGKITKEATCVSKGIKTYTCKACGSTRTEELPYISGLYKSPTDGKWYYMCDGKINKSFTGMVKKNSKGHLRFVRNGVMDLTYTGLALDPNNHWRFVRNGVMDSSFSGIAQNTNGKWYYCKNGRINTSFTNMIAKNTNGKLHFVVNGRPTSKFNGIAYCPEANNWYYCTNGRVDFKFSGKVALCTNGNYYYVTKSRIDKSFTGIATGTDGKKYYVIKGLVDKNYSGTVTYKGKTYTVVKGVVK